MNLNIFNTANLFEAATNLFQQLGIKLNSNTAEPLPTKDILKHHYKDNDTFKAIDKTYFIGIIDDSVFKATGMFDINYSYKEAIEQGDKNGLMLFALELKKQPTRTEISELTRAFNRTSQKMPVALVLKYPPTSLLEGNEVLISISLSERFKYLQNWRQGEKAGKVIILRDIQTQNTHAGHIRILQDLVKPVGVTNYEQLHQHWLQVLDVNILNKKFFQDLANWYFWAMNKVSFPDDLEEKEEVRNATNLIRLITRVIFIWFLKEKHLVPASLFHKHSIENLLKDFNKNPQSHNYYNAILQNLFFGTLNQKIEERKFVREGDFQTNREEYGVKNLFRYADLFTRSEQEIIQLFKDVPFLNGGLFDCLDKPNDEAKIEYVDGFSRNTKKKAIVPDYIFFGEEKQIDLNQVYGTKNKRYTSQGLINILESYKFTVAENTPIEEEIALDPELLGKVFENLLASYNPETQTTARKQTGSFYTPREIVNYMVDESLLEYIKQNVKNNSKDFETRLRDVFSYSEKPNPFNESETKDIIEAINNCKILDPACGSGAFPMGILHKMVHILQKLDPHNKYWKEIQRERIIGDEIKKLEQDKKAIEGLSDQQVRNKALEAVQQRLDELEEIFNNEYNFDDYSRKLYLIENCIYGIDIQPIAVQIAKLRFFISLVIDQKVNESKENRGIRSLPNLEAKFVAANALIGLDKPEQPSLRNPEIDSKEMELKDLRHKYFTANTRRDKLDLRRKDKELRKKIADLLKNGGWQSKVAEQVASFDPYDQNHFANWFDQEWMFGMTNGFDIVIGNPPYIQLQKAFNNTLKFADLYKEQKFKTFDRTGDIYCLFYEKGIQLLKENGLLAYITSNKWMRAGYGEKLREFFRKYNPLQLVDLGPGVFENATVDTNILIIQKANNQNKLKAITLQKQDKEDIFKALKEKAVVLTKLSKDAWFIGSDAEQKLKEKIERIGKPLKDWDVKIFYGIKTGLNDAFIITTEKRNEILANCKDKEERKRTEQIIKPILRGRDIKRYHYEWAGLWVIGTFPALHLNIDNYPALKKYFLDNFDKRQLEQSGKKYPELGFDARKKTGNKWFETQDQIAYYPEFEKEKVVWKALGLEPAFAFVPPGFYNNDKANLLTSNTVPLRFLVGFFNTTIFQWIFRSIGINMGQGFEYKLQFIEQIPIPTITPANQPIVKQIELLVDKILEAKKQSTAADTKHLEDQIDIMVYKLYELIYEEVKVIDPAFALSREEYELKTSKKSFKVF